MQEWFKPRGDESVKEYKERIAGYMEACYRDTIEMFMIEMPRSAEYKTADK